MQWLAPVHRSLGCQHGVCLVLLCRLGYALRSWASSEKRERISVMPRTCNNAENSEPRKPWRNCFISFLPGQAPPSLPHPPHCVTHKRQSAFAFSLLSAQCLASNQRDGGGALDVNIATDVGRKWGRDSAQPRPWPHQRL